jgi:transcription antitermination factor NusG
MGAQREAKGGTVSKFYKLMNNGPDNARQVRSYVHVRPMRDVDNTHLSPLIAPADCMIWRIAMTEPRREAEACQHLRKSGYAAWFPQETIIKTNAAKRERATVNVPLFARYVFVGLRSNATGPIAACKRVSHLLPYSAPVRLIQELYRRQTGGEFNATAPEFQRDDVVRLSEGPFAELDLIVTKANHDRVSVLVSMFGSNREIEVAADIVKKVAA